ncbi:MAG: polysaccharide biosynthesis/export family protein, partial [Cyanobacteriota bacterium]|nr:polysaccharide biosynthesis/export family protein [Cyanobacteriota bacterium]
MLLCSQLLSPLQAAVQSQSPAPAATGSGVKVEANPTANDLTDLDAYILGSGDRLEISFLSATYANLGGTFELLNDGSTSLPMIGSVVLDGLTLNQANRWLAGLYRRYLRQPELNLRVAQPRPM